MISLGGEFHHFGAEAENDPPKREVSDLGIDNEPFVAYLKFRFCISDRGFNKLEMYSGARLHVSNVL